MSRIRDVPCTDRRVLRTRRAIREAFRVLLIRDGYERITVSALARQADIDRKTFYLHYDCLDDLVHEEAQMLADQVAEALLVGRDSEGLTVNLRDVLRRLADLCMSDPDFYRRIIAELPMEVAIEALLPPVRARVLEGGYPRSVAERTALDSFIRFYLGGILAVFMHWFLEDSKTSIDQLVDETRRLTGDARLFHMD